MRFTLIGLALTLALPVAAQTIPDSIANPIETSCGVRLDPAAYLWSVGTFTPGESAALDSLEGWLREANAPFGRQWLQPGLDVDARGAALDGLRANYLQWWATVQEILGPDRAAALLKPEPVKPDDPEALLRRCISRTTLAVLRLPQPPRMRR